MPNDSVLEIVAYGAWNDGTIVDNSIYEQKRYQFKGGIPVNNKTIEERMGVRTRKVAGTDERIGVTALQDLLDTSEIDPSRIKVVIGATNVGDDKYDPGPLIKYPYEIIRERGNCSVVCMQRLPYDLMRGALQPDSLQGFAINRNLDRLKEARLILNDSVGAGMTRSSFLQRV